LGVLDRCAQKIVRKPGTPFVGKCTGTPFNELAPVPQTHHHLPKLPQSQPLLHLKSWSTSDLFPSTPKPENPPVQPMQPSCIPIRSTTPINSHMRPLQQHSNYHCDHSKISSSKPCPRCLTFPRAPSHFSRCSHMVNQTFLTASTPQLSTSWWVYLTASGVVGEIAFVTESTIYLSRHHHNRV
jgi:hypothetical protein